MTSIEDCCKVLKRKTKLNLHNSTVSHAYMPQYCYNPNCTKAPCIKARFYKKYLIYKDAFEPIDVVYYIKTPCEISKLFDELDKLFDKILAFECFGLSEAYFSMPKSSLVDLTVFTKVNFYNEIEKTIYEHVLNKRKIVIKKSLRRVRFKNIHLNERIKRIATIDGVYATDSGITNKQNSERVKHVLPKDVLFEFYEEKNSLKIIRLTMKEIMSISKKDYYLNQMPGLYGLTDDDFEKFL